jgi:hypothetical protein
MTGFEKEISFIPVARAERPHQHRANWEAQQVGYTQLLWSLDAKLDDLEIPGDFK